MKKILFVSSAFGILLISQSLMIMKKDGAAPGYTGSPGDSLKNCTACHGGVAVTVEDWITSDIPADGYVPGMTYTITATNKEFGATRFGFEISPQDTIGNLMGSMAITDNVRTKLVGGTKYITYTENGVEGVDSLSWSFKWTAPKSIEDVTFYGGFNSNFDGHKGGDQTFLSTLTVKRNKALDIPEVSNLKAVKIYPNPTYDYIIVNLNVRTACNIVVDITDMNGKQVSLLMNNKVNSGTFNQQFEINTLAKGNYLVRINANGKVSAQRLSINR
jgi:hypothetical protein